MKKAIRSGLSLIMTVVMCLALLPMTALAVKESALLPVYQSDGFYITVTKANSDLKFSHEKFSSGVVYARNTATGTYGFYDKNGNLIVKLAENLSYPSDNGFRDGLLSVYISEKSDSLYGSDIHYAGFIDMTGNVVIKASYSTNVTQNYVWYNDFSDGLARYTSNNEVGFINKSGNIALKCNSTIEESIKSWEIDFHEGLAICGDKSWLPDDVFVIDKTGNRVFTINGASPIRGMEKFTEGYCILQKHGFDNPGCIVIDKSGNTVLDTSKVSERLFGAPDAMDFGYGANYSGVQGGLIKYNYNGKHGAIDINGNDIIPPIYYMTGDFICGVASVNKDNENAVIDNKNNVVIPYGIFDEIGPFNENLSIAQINGSDASGYYILEKHEGTYVPTESPKAPNLDSASSWASDGIQQGFEKGFIPADLQSNYTNVITRQEFCRMAVKWLEYKLGKNIDAILADKGLSRNPNAFSDTNDADILAAFALGITSGTAAPTADKPGTFTPNGEFSREQAATMIRNTCKAAGMDISNVTNAGFADIGTASTWAVDGINYVRNAGIMQGTSTTPLLFSPKATYTREQSILTFNNIK